MHRLSAMLRWGLLSAAYVVFTGPVAGQTSPNQRTPSGQRPSGVVQLNPGRSPARPVVGSRPGVGAGAQVNPGAAPPTNAAGGQRPPPGQPVPGHETEQTTIRKALVDLRSRDPEARLRAVLILGKFREPDALAAVQGALNDADARVRRAALVSFHEHPYVVPTAVSDILRMLADPDVHVRRIASSGLPDLLGARGLILGQTGTGRISPAIQTSVRQVQLREQEEVIRNAFADEDAIVRKNMLSYFSLVSSVVDPEMLLLLLKDPERDNRILALDAAANAAASNRLPRHVFVREAATLAGDEDRLIRMALVEALARIVSVDAHAVLKQLAADQDLHIAARAFVTLLRRGILTNADLIDKFLATPNLDPGVTDDLIMALPMMGATGKAKLEALFKHERSTYRESAIDAYVREFVRQSSPDVILPMVEDDASGVRMRARSALLRMKPLPPKAVTVMSSSRHADVREFAATMAGDLPAEDAEEVLLDLLLDEDTNVRQSALRQIVSQGIPGWQDIVRQTLEDENPDMRAVATEALHRLKETASLPLLLELLEQTTDPRLQVGLRNQAMQAARRAVESGTPQEKAEAAEALANVQDVSWAAMVIFLEGAANDPGLQAKIRLQAQRLATAAFTTGTPAEQNMVASALPRVRDVSWLPVLSQVGLRIKDPKLRARVQMQVRQLQALRAQQLRAAQGAGQVAPGGNTTVRPPQNKVSPNVPH